MHRAAPPACGAQARACSARITPAYPPAADARRHDAEPGMELARFLRQTFAERYQVGRAGSVRARQARRRRRAAQNCRGPANRRVTKQSLRVQRCAPKLPLSAAAAGPPPRRAARLPRGC